MDLQQGDVVQGSVLADAPLNIFIMGERAYHDYWNTRDPSGKTIAEDETSARIKRTAPRSGRWFLVLDTYGKQSPRIAKVRLERARVVTA
ncbi:MAG TPA: hypothetical protein VHI93_03645 [Candidatus Thermoplasmatota archaeon]|nr:hypothetical protein [Candidatus Thermoplasmatota archaeon]